MKLSTKGRYGLRAMLDMALHADDGPITVHSIAERENLSDRYLEQLLVPLKKVGLVKSLRGAQGGYVLGKEPKDITVGEIIRALEGPIAPVDCVSEDHPENCVRADHCVTRLIWTKLRDSMAEVLDSYNLEDLIKESKALSSGDRNMYYI